MRLLDVGGFSLACFDGRFHEGRMANILCKMLNLTAGVLGSGVLNSELAAGGH